MGSLLSLLQGGSSISDELQCLVAVNPKLIANALRRYHADCRHPGLTEEGVRNVASFLTKNAARNVYRAFLQPSRDMVNANDVLGAMILFSGAKSNKRTKMLFELFDIAGDGSINEAEMTMGVRSCLRAYTVCTGCEHVPTSVAEMCSTRAFEDADDLPDGKISYIEFWSWLSKNPQAREVLGYFQKLSVPSAGTRAGDHGSPRTPRGQPSSPSTPYSMGSNDKYQYLENDDDGDGAAVPAVQMSYGDAFSNTDKETDLRFRAKGALDRIAHDESKRRHRKEHESDRRCDPEHIVYDPSTRDTEVDDILGKVDAIARRAESGGHSPGGRRRPSKPKQAGDHGGEGHSRRGHEKPSHRRKRHAGNGTIKYSKKEVMMIKDLFDKMDENGDGTVTLWEFSRDPTLGAHYGGMFEVLDANKDGVITIRELIGELYSAASQEELETMFDWIRPPSISAKTVKKVMLTPDQEQEMTLLFRDYDEDQSGVLSVNELIAALTANQAFSADEVRDYFRRADISHDGELSVEEFTDFFKTQFFDKTEFAVGALTNLDDIAQDHEQLVQKMSHGVNPYQKATDVSHLATF